MEFIGLPLWLWWVALAVALILLDLTLLGLQFILVATGLGALVAAGTAAMGLNFPAQMWAFVLATAVLIPIMIALFRRLASRSGPGPLEPGWAEGAEVRVLNNGTRLVAKLKSDTYPVRLSDGSPPIDGETLIVERMEGITLIARRPPSSPTQGA